MNKLLVIPIFIFIALYLLIWAYLAFRTYLNENSDTQKQFALGQMPNPLPDGEYNGKVEGYRGAWKGKKFNREEQKGINLFGDEEKYPFTMYQASDSRDPNRSVLAIDYDVSENPWWLRFLLDEVVETKPGHYQGKIIIRWIFGSTFTLGYFELEQ